MKNSRLINVLSKLDETDMSQLKDMTLSPFFNKNKKVILLWETLASFRKEMEDGQIVFEVDHPNFNRQYIFEKMYPGKTKITSSLNVEMSKLLSLVKELLVKKELEERPFHKRQLLMRGLLRIDERSFFVNQYKESKMLLDNHQRRDTDSYLENYLIEREYRQYLDGEKGRTARDYLRKEAIALDTFYLARRLNISCEMLNLNLLFAQDYDFPLLDAFGQIIRQPTYQENSFIQFYHAVLKILRNRQDTEGFNNLVSLLGQPIAKGLSKAEISEIFTHAINFCSEKIQEGQKEYLQKVFELYQLLILKGLIYKGKYLDLGRFKNIIGTACQVNQTAWAKEETIKFKKDFDPKYGDGAYNYFMAIINFYEGDYQAADHHLGPELETEDVFFGMNIKSLRLRCYYELDKSRAFYGLSKSFGSALRRKKDIHKITKLAYSNFLKNVNLIYKYKEGFSKRALPGLKEKLESAQVVAHKDWLMEKLEELKRIR